MEGDKSLKEVMNKIKDVPSVTDALLMTKTGMLVLGTLGRSTHLENFVGMAAILMGSAEAVSLEMEESVKRVVIGTKSSKIAITSISKDILLAVALTAKQDYENVLDELEQIIAVQ